MHYRRDNLVIVLRSDLQQFPIWKQMSGRGGRTLQNGDLMRGRPLQMVVWGIALRSCVEETFVYLSITLSNNRALKTKIR
jgi:hypothetical protein